MNNMLPAGARYFFITATRRNEKINPLFLWSSVTLAESSKRVREDSEVGGQRSEVGRRTSEVGGQMSEIGRRTDYA